MSFHNQDKSIKLILDIYFHRHNLLRSTENSIILFISLLDFLVILYNEQASENYGNEIIIQSDANAQVSFRR